MIDGGIGAQLAHVSPAWDLFTSQFGVAATAAGFYIPGTPVVSDAGEAGATDAATDAEAGTVIDAGTPPVPPTFIPIEGTAKSGTLTPLKLATVPGVTVDGGSGFFAEGIAADGGAVLIPPGCIPGTTGATGCVSPLLLPLPIINELTIGSTTPNIFANGAGYVFVLVGDPTAPTYVSATTGQTCADPTTPPCTFNTKFPHFLAFPTAN